MKKCEGDVSIQEIPFNEASFWVQLHDLPIRFMNKTVVESVCDIVGKVCRSIGGVEKEGSSFMRVKITLNISLLSLLRPSNNSGKWREKMGKI